ncbi:MAG: Holliday junction resolvase RuvX [Candidatus Accumulibacter sp.]|jgi:putative Holliday junction resolvase|nr:Holliday junction resolvase RuvX [Accumulibacter sp.]
MPDSESPPRGTVLAFDFGEKRIGVAVGETALGQAHPLTTIRSHIQGGPFAAIAALIREWKPVALVVGRPVSLDGAPHAMTARCARFAADLRRRFALPVDFAEERLSSVEAEDRLRAGGHSAKSAKEYVDALAAQVILEYYFESRAALRAPEPEYAH